MNKVYQKILFFVTAMAVWYIFALWLCSGLYYGYETVWLIFGLIFAILDTFGDYSWGIIKWLKTA